MDFSKRLAQDRQNRALGGGFNADDVTYGVDKTGNMYVYNKTHNKMVYYGDRNYGFQLVSARQADGAINAKYEGDQRQAEWDAEANRNNTNIVQTQSPTSTGNNYTGESSYNAAAAEEARQKAFYQALLNSLPGAKSRDQGLIDQKYSDSFNRLVSQRDQAFGNLDREQSKLDKQRATAYSQIQNDSQNLLQGLNTQLGMVGAGNSSAAQMGAIATADVANKQSAAITDDYNDQVSDITFNQNKIKKDFEDENQELNTWKKEQQTNLEKEYTNLENDYRGKIGGQANLDSVTRSFENMKNPEVKVNTLPDYKANGLDKVDLSGQIKSPQLSAQQAQQYFTNTSTMNKKKEEEKKDGLAV